MTTFGERIKALRVADERSMAHVARKVGLTRAFILQLEAGKANPGVETLAAFARLYGKTMDEMWTGEKTNAA